LNWEMQFDALLGAFFWRSLFWVCVFDEEFWSGFRVLVKRQP